MFHTNAMRCWKISFDLIINSCTALNICLFWSKVSDISPHSRTLRFGWQISDTEFIKLHPRSVN